MDTLKILLGATIALLLGALAVSWQHLQTGEKNAGSEELAKLRHQVEELRREQDSLALEKQRLALQEAAARPAPVEPSPAETANASEITAMKEQIAALEEEKRRAERDAELENQEGAFREGMDFQKKNSDVRRARLIREALLIARIREWVEDPNLGGFGTIELVRPENVQPGSELLVRRNTGVLGKVRVGEVTIEGGIINPVTQFGEVKPEPGDELILEPPFFGDSE